MVAAIRQTVTITSPGTLELYSDELRQGDQAEVTVLINRPQEVLLTPLQALHALQKSIQLTPEAAQAWSQQVRQERESLGPRA